VGYPTADRFAPALSYTAAGLSVVFLGLASSEPGHDLADRVVPVVPLLASLLHAEQAAQVAQGELRAAQSHARDVETLARALDAARSEVERTVLQLERQTRAADEARTRAEDATRAKDEFLAMLGHELRNPLSPILTALQLMRLKNQASREQDVIERQVASLMRLVDDLLDVSRITGGKIELRKERVELADIAVRAIEMASPVLEKKQQVLRVRIPPRGFVLDVDPSRVAQVLANLLTNAAKYSDPETQVEFEAERAGNDVRITVKDYGIGIAPDMLTRVFDLFVQHRQAIDRSQGGLGLGLAIVRSLVEMHDGTVVASSAGVGHGSEFIVTLPCAVNRVSECAPSVIEAAEPLRRAAGRARVLVVDDNDDAATLMADALGSLGYHVRTASDGPSALRVSAEFEPALTLLDIGLPVMDGYELAHRLRQQHQSASLRLVAVTGYGQGEDKRRSEEAGFDAHLTKPISLEQLQRVIEGLQTPETAPLDEPPETS
jgi:signal transduction histidine kinase/ActR/RegA family two-component response regulator